MVAYILFLEKKFIKKIAKHFPLPLQIVALEIILLAAVQTMFFGAEKTRHNSISLQPVTTTALSDIDPNSLSSQEHVVTEDILTVRSCTLDQSIPTQILKLMKESEDRSDSSKHGLNKNKKNKEKLISSLNKSNSYNRFAQQKKS